MFRDAYYARPGDIRNLRLVNEEIADPKPHEVQVTIKAIGLNFADVFCVLGLYTAAPKSSFVPGIEFAGVVSKVGAAVSEARVGDKVMGVTRFGAYASALNVGATYIEPIPSGWSYAEGAGYLVAVLTAYYGLIEQCHLKKEETVLIQSAAGGVGIMANRIAKRLGCYTIGTVGTEKKIQFCKTESCDRVIVRSHDFVKDVHEALGSRNLDVVMECIGGTYYRKSLKLLGVRGRMAVYGFAYYMPKTVSIPYLRTIWKYITRPRIDIFQMQNKSISSFNLIYLFDHADELREMLEHIKALNIGRPIIGSQFSFADLPRALAVLKSGSTKGKVIVVLPE